MEKEIDRFIEYLKYQRNYSDFTCNNYNKDLNEYNSFILSNKINYKNMDYNEAKEYVIYLNKKNDDIVDSKKKIEKKNDEDKYDLAFNFTNSDKKNDSKLTSENLQQEVPSHNDLIEENKENAFINKDIIINNAFAVASKMVKQNLQDRFSKIEEYLTDKRFASAVSLFVDTDLEVAGEGYIIFTGKYDAIVDNISRNLLICKEFINNLFDDKYNFIVITKDEWNKYREEYIKNIKSGKKYELKEFEQQNKIIDNTVVENEPTVVDRLFDIVGEDIIEFK